MDQADLKKSFPESSAAAKLDLPSPQLDLDFRMSVALNPKISLGEGPWGARNWISFQGGNWTASWGNGTVEASPKRRPHFGDRSLTGPNCSLAARIPNSSIPTP